ncbi:MAG: anaphase promoting complex subunit doc1 [Candelina mexicana]|nr:MAG: anaphase promoting complex subunit doc1 [Candelina mexicana]
MPRIDASRMEVPQAPTETYSTDADISGADGAEEEEMEDVEGGDLVENAETEIIELFDVSHLKEIGNLASWTVSTSKPGCGVEALRSEDSNLFWQSDGPQPHLLNIHFFKLVSIVHIRIFLDFENDESYTPTKMSFLAGTGHHDLQEFVELTFEQPKGWIDVSLDGVGGRERYDEDPAGDDRQTSGNVLRAFVVQVRIAENHQNGKDTHVRGLQIFAKDDTLGRRAPAEEFVEARDGRKRNAFIGLEEPSWMRDPELR